MAIVHRNNLDFLTSNLLDGYGIQNGFFMRHGGCSPSPWRSLNMATSVGDSRNNVQENRKRIASALGISPTKFFDLWQVHSTDIVITKAPRKKDEPHTKADASITNQENIALMGLFADCVPILFYDPHREIIAMAHAGWKGTLGEIAKETILKMEISFQSQPEDIVAIIGPAICQKHYEIGENVFNAAKEVFNPGDFQEVCANHEGRIFLDLPKCNEKILLKCGVDRIERLDICTVCHNEDWFSHRGEKGQTGRFAALIKM